MTLKKRIGAYGIALQNNHLLLITKGNGIFQGLLDLPGGGIEEGETPQEALVRELREEVAMSFSSCKPIIITTFQAPADFQFVGHLFTIHDLQLLSSSPEEKFAWHPLLSLTPNLLTPFAKEALSWIHAKSK